MNKIFLVVLLILGIIFIFWYGSGNLQNRVETPPNVIEYLEVNKLNEFTQAIDVREFSFPLDYGAHDQFLTEWWYYTGNLQTEEGRHFGYQLTFFRRAISDETNLNPLSNWSASQIYLAHFAITDTENQDHYVTDQISRNANGLAGTAVDPNFSIWLNHWEINQLDDGSFDMKASEDDFEIIFRLEKQKDEVLHGDQGLSQKSEEPGNASYYYSQTRLLTYGRLRIGQEWFSVNGYSWMDHEFGTSTLGDNQVGWDWFSMQFDNHTELMLFQIRNEEGSMSEFSSGTFVDTKGKISNLSIENFEIQVIDSWINPNGFTYPSGWIVKVADLEIDLTITPVIENQEMNLFFQYWEGAVFIEGIVNGEDISGFGYVELTGYAQSMQGVF